MALSFGQTGWTMENAPLSESDFTANARIDYADVVWLFNDL